MEYLMNEVPVETVAEAAEAAPQLFFEPANFITNLQYMGIGMVVIFAIIAIIILATMLTGYLFSENEEAEA